MDRHRQRVHEDIDDSFFTLPVEEDGANEVVANWLPGFVASLEPEYAEAVRLVDLEGVSQKELAARLGLSASGARTRVQRGRKQLKEKLLECCHVALEHGDVVDVRPKDCGC
jgi:RNA polymerase sigma-70 factor (ECF subfamily)